MSLVERGRGVALHHCYLRVEIRRMRRMWRSEDPAATDFRSRTKYTV